HPSRLGVERTVHGEPQHDRVVAGRRPGSGERQRGGRQTGYVQHGQVQGRVVDHHGRLVPAALQLHHHHVRARHHVSVGHHVVGGVHEAGAFNPPATTGSVAQHFYHRPGDLPHHRVDRQRRIRWVHLGHPGGGQSTEHV